MKFFSIPTLLICSFGLLLSSCDVEEICERGKGTRVTLAVPVPALTGIDLAISGDVYLTQGEEQSVEIIGQENLIALLDLDVNGQGEWVIEFNQCVRKASDFDIYITVPNLDKITLSGSGNIEGQNQFAIDNMDIDLSGSGNIVLDMTGTVVSSSISGSGNMALKLAGTSLATKISGSGNMDMSGSVDSHSSKISGSGDIKAFEFITRETRIDISGSGSADIYADEILNVDISGSGNVNYKGYPAIDVNISGSGQIRNAN